MIAGPQRVELARTLQCDFGLSVPPHMRQNIAQHAVPQRIAGIELRCLAKRCLRGTILHHDVVSLQLLRSDVAVVEVLTSVTGFQKLAPGLNTDKEGRLRTRLLQVLVKDKGAWQIVAYHNVDVKSQTPVPDPEVASIH
jgi:hypothetical protein